MDILIKFHDLGEIILEILQLLTISLNCILLRNNNSSKLLQPLVILTDAPRDFLVRCLRFIELVYLLLALLLLFFQFLNCLLQMFVFVENFWKRSLWRLIIIGTLNVAVGIFGVNDTSIGYTSLTHIIN